ncbi:MAG TPA: hypothetical protein ENO20_09270 [Bacteroides sp.]|nr:hypothetical protein [Bacteroides sp.]
MKRLLIGSIVAALLIPAGSWVAHEFYVSLTEIRYNGDTERLEISMRIFPDDLDRALKIRHGISTHLATRLEPPGADSLLAQYLYDHFSVEVNDNEVDLVFLGKEPESDAIWCYLESEPVPLPSGIRVKNSILTGEFRDQVNIVQIYVGDWNRGILLSAGRESDTLKIVR